MIKIHELTDTCFFNHQYENVFNLGKIKSQCYLQSDSSWVKTFTACDEYKKFQKYLKTNFHRELFDLERQVYHSIYEKTKEIEPEMYLDQNRIARIHYLLEEGYITKSFLREVIHDCIKHQNSSQNP